MEQLELFSNQDYEDALAWLIEGIDALGLDSDDKTEMISEYKNSVPNTSSYSRYYYFQEAFVVLDNWTR